MKMILALLVIVGIGVGFLQYPSAATWFVALQNQRELAALAAYVGGYGAGEQPAMLTAADQYNEDLRNHRVRLTDDLTDEYYLSLLRVGGVGPIGEIIIPTIDVDLAIFPGTHDANFDRGVGHLYGTSLPVGGAGTHSALVAHAGLQRASLFTDLAHVEVDDHFMIKVAGRKNCYQVADTRVVVPDDLKNLRIEDGIDQVTLVTCYPTHVNSHRLLVRGLRVECPDDLAAMALGGPGFPWWAAIWLGSLAAAYGFGKFATRPAKAKGQLAVKEGFDSVVPERSRRAQPPRSSGFETPARGSSTTQPAHPATLVGRLASTCGCGIARAQQAIAERGAPCSACA